MKKTLLFLVSILISASLMSQVVNFTGTWKINSTKSSLNQEFSLAPLKVTVVQKGNDLSVEKVSRFQDQEFTTTDKFTLDGKECINTGWQDSQKKSSAVWADDKKSLKITSKLAIGEGGDVTIVEVFRMDGSNMVLESSAYSSYGDMVETIFYDKG